MEKEKIKSVYQKKDNWKNDTWRPAVFNTAQELQERIDEYFKWWHRKKSIPVKNKQWDIIDTIDVDYITITDLCIYLWFESRQSFYDYEKNGNFSYIIKRARLFVEREYEELLRINPTWAIFALKNFWRSDKLELANPEGETFKTEVKTIIDIT